MYVRCNSLPVSSKGRMGAVIISNESGPSRRVLEPNERISEVLFGLIMVLTFTGSLSVAEVGREDIRTMLIGALGCNIAWGIIDGVLYLMGALAERGKDLALLKSVRAARDPERAYQLIADALPASFASVLDSSQFEVLRERLTKLPEPQMKAQLKGKDFKGAVGVFWLVFLSTFPVALPFIFMREAVAAMRISNAIAVGMLFLTGVAYARCVGRSPWVLGLSMIGLGGALVALTMALGG